MSAGEGDGKGNATRLDAEKLREIRALLKNGIPKAQIARQLSISRSTVYEAKLLESETSGP